jgi:hypothetical protein
MRTRRWIILGAFAIAVVGAVIAGMFVPGASEPLKDRTYTTADLTSILKKVQASAGAKGKLYDDAQFKRKLSSSGLTKVIDEPITSEQGVEVTPAKCPGLLAALPMTNPQVGPSTNESESELSIGDTTLVLATVPSATVSPSAWSNLVRESAAADKACRTFGISFHDGKTFYAIEVGILKVKVTTKAQHSLAFEEAVGFPPAGIVFFDVENVQSVEGNLYINATRVISSPPGSPASYRKTLIAYTNEVLKYASKLPPSPEGSLP